MRFPFPLPGRILWVALFLSAAACRGPRNLTQELLLQPWMQDSLLRTAHLGLKVVDLSGGGRVLASYQEEKYFVPASNTKLFSLYAGLRYLGDSLPGLFTWSLDTALVIMGAGDPSFLHPDYDRQPILDLLRRSSQPLYLTDQNWKEEAWGPGWAWDDYNDDYMVERSSLPVYGGLVHWYQDSSSQGGGSPAVYSIPEIPWKVHFLAGGGNDSSHTFQVHRLLQENVFEIDQGNGKPAQQQVPFVTGGVRAALELLPDTLQKNIGRWKGSGAQLTLAKARLWRSRPSDSLLRPMMWRSDNFFADQVLLMTSQQVLGYMNQKETIARLLDQDLRGLPQRPRWVDGSGLSPYNLFTPADMVWLLDLLQSRFGIEHMQRLLPTGGQGTLRNSYKLDSGAIFAKTGSLSGVMTLSGYLWTEHRHLLAFSILINHHLATTRRIRTLLEAYLHQLRERN